MAATEQQLKQINLMRELALAGMAARREARFDNFMFLVQSGTSVNEAAARIGTNPVALERQAYRWGRTDIVRTMGAAAYRQRQDTIRTRQKTGAQQ